MSSGFDNFDEMFSQSIGIRAPWKITKSEFDDKTHSVNIYVSARKTALYPCPECGVMCTRRDNEDSERVWQHGDVVFFPCFIHCRRPRIKCPKCGKIHVVTAPWARKGSRYTLLFEAYSMLLAQKLPIEQARKFLRISHTSLSAIVRHYVDKNVAADDLSSVSAICVDETSLKRGQSYVTVVGDAVNRRVIDVENGRSAEQVVEFSLKLEEKGGDCNKIMCATSDMSSAYLSAIQECFPKATRIIDKFHVSKLMRQAMNKVRHEEQGKLSKRKKAGRKLLMIPENNMTEEQRARANEICKQYPHTGRAFRMVQAFDTFYRSMDLNEAQEQFGKLISWLKRSRLEPMKRVAKTLVMQKDAILAYFLTRLTNAMAEGINSLIQAGKRKARGFKTFEGYSTMIYLTCSKINFAPIPLFS